MLEWHGSSKVSRNFPEGYDEKRSHRQSHHIKAREKARHGFKTFERCKEKELGAETKWHLRQWKKIPKGFLGRHGIIAWRDWVTNLYRNR